MRLFQRRDEPTHITLSTDAIERHLVASQDGLWAWFRLGRVPWAFRSRGDRDTILADTAHRWSEIAGRTVHFRVRSTPFDYNQWAQRLDRAAVDRLPDPDEGETWDEYLTAAQLAMVNKGLSDPQQFLGVRVSKKTGLTRDLLTKVLDPTLIGELDNAPKTWALVSELAAELEVVTGIMARPGFSARPVTAVEMNDLFRGSITLGVPAPTKVKGITGWDSDEIATVAGSVYHHAEPLAPHATVETIVDGERATAMVTVLSVGRMEGRDTSNVGLAPWVSFSSTLPFAVEWSAILEVVPGDQLRTAAERILTRARSIHSHYTDDHQEEPPAETAAAIAAAEQSRNEIVNGTPDKATRLIGAWRCAVFSDNPTQVARHVRELVSRYGSADQRIELEPSFGQVAMLTEFIPGEEHRSLALSPRVMSGQFAATAVPNAATGLGDSHGPYLGTILTGGKSPVLWDPTWGPRHNKSGLVALVGGLGSGKSTLVGAIAEPHARLGHRTILVDPSGPLARLTELPHLRKHAKHTDLSGVVPGTLNPYRLIPLPKRKHFDTDSEWKQATAEADADRRELFIDTLVMMIDPNGDERDAIVEAVASVGAEWGQNPWEAVEWMRRHSGHGEKVAKAVDTIANLKGGTLIFPTSRTRDQAFGSNESYAVLDVITMRGITPPVPGTDRRSWSRAETMAVPVLHLAAHYARRAMYQDNEPKVIITDEGGIIAAAGSSFRNFLLRGSRDSRKHNTMFGVGVQNPSDMLEISPEISNLLGAVFCGRVEGTEPQKAALQLLGGRVPLGAGYESLLGRLTPGQFLVRDYEGRVDVLGVDIEYRPILADALNTTPPSIYEPDQKPSEPYEVSIG